MLNVAHDSANAGSSRIWRRLAYSASREYVTCSQKLRFIKHYLGVQKLRAADKRLIRRVVAKRRIRRMATGKETMRIALVIEEYDPSRAAESSSGPISSRQAANWGHEIHVVATLCTCVRPPSDSPLRSRRDCLTRIRRRGRVQAPQAARRDHPRHGMWLARQYLSAAWWLTYRGGAAKPTIAPFGLALENQD